MADTAGTGLPPSAIAQQIWDMKYRFKDESGAALDATVADTWARVATTLAAQEKEPARWAQSFKEALADYVFLPAGRILAGAGTGRKVTLHNCFVMGAIGDDMGSIFAHLREAALPALLQSRSVRKSIRIWCAASSTGQEPYSIAMCLKEMGAALAGWRIEILATDLSQEVLEKSRSGIYSQFEVQRGLPIQLLVKHFKQIGELWQINADLRAMIQHRQLNLLQDFSHLGKFDLIFCRNVLIYFDRATQQAILSKLIAHLVPAGYLFVGHSETLHDMDLPVMPVAPALYRKADALV